MSWLTLTAAVLGGTALGTVLGKVIDLLFLEPARAKTERVRWLREARLRAFARVAEEIGSSGWKTAGPDPLTFRQVTAEAELLLDDSELLQTLRTYVDDVCIYNRAIQEKPPKGFVFEDGASHSSTLEDFESAGLEISARGDDLIRALGERLQGT